MVAIEQSGLGMKANDLGKTHKKSLYQQTKLNLR